MQKVRQLRRERVWTVRDLADKAGVSKNTITRAENGGSVYPTSIRKIASALGVEPTELVRKA